MAVESKDGLIFRRVFDQRSLPFDAAGLSDRGWSWSSRRAWEWTGCSLSSFQRCSCTVLGWASISLECIFRDDYQSCRKDGDLIIKKRMGRCCVTYPWTRCSARIPSCPGTGCRVCQATEHTGARSGSFVRWKFFRKVGDKMPGYVWAGLCKGWGVV